MATVNLNSSKMLTVKQACLTLIVGSPLIDVCCISVTRSQFSSSVLHITACGISSGYFRDTSGNEAPRVPDPCDVGIVSTFFVTWLTHECSGKAVLTVPGALYVG